jgi:hypothetical protein
MTNEYRLLQSTRTLLLKKGLLAIMAVALLAVSVVSNAQTTTASIRGKIQDENGATVSGASVVVEDLRSGVQRSYATNESGLFLATRLLPGGPYQVTVNGRESVGVASINVGETYNLTVDIQAGSIEEIVAIGQASDLIETTSGPSATFNLDAIENSVAFSRDISDVYGLDPRLMVDADEDGFGINCAGKHPRFNNLTLDGVSTSDRFGLNENGYSTAVGMPFPFDAIEQIAVELAPFDVTYGGFSACNINSVTKSGTNEWEAKAFYEYSNDGFRGDHVPDSDSKFALESYDKTYYGANIGGPIIKDKLFFFAAYETSEEPRFLARGYAGSGTGTERPWFSQSDFTTITSLAQSIYNYDAGGLSGDGVQDAEKYLARFDWNINDSHNAAFIYSYFDGFQDRNSDDSGSQIELSNHGYVKGAESETFTLKLSSQWTDALSTELFYSSSEMNDSQVTVGDKDFAEMQISIGNNTVFIGADDSRQANSLSTESEYFKVAMNYLAGNHVITAGYDAEKLDIFNIFVQHSKGGEMRFFDNSVGTDPACFALTPQQRYDRTVVVDSDGNAANNTCRASGIDSFTLGRPDRIYYGSGGGSNVATDAAAIFSNTLNAVYLQDEIYFDDKDLTIVAGLRYEWFDSSDTPNYNAIFEATTGYANDSGLDGLDIVMPRLGFTWGVRDDLMLRGGIGLYSGGNPNVWISNGYSNDGLTNAQFERRSCSGTTFIDETGVCTWTLLPGSADTIALSGAGRPGYDPAQAMVDDVLAVTPADGNDIFIAFIDPQYEQPSEWKLALGGTYDLPWGGMTLDVDYLYSKGNDPALYNDVSQAINTAAGLSGYTIIGEPIYSYQFGQDNLMLTNSSRSPEASTISFVLRKEFDSGLNLMLGYAYTDAEDVSPMTSSTAGSNFDIYATSDVNNPGAATSNWAVPQRITLHLDYAKAFFGDNETRFTLMGYINEGQPQTYTMGNTPSVAGTTRLEGDAGLRRQLLYIPDGPTDPNVVFTWDQATSDAFFAWVDDNNLSSGLVRRNSQFTGWTQRFDLRISQDIPLGGDFRGRVYLKIYNLGNLLNDDWGKVTDAEFFSPDRVTAGVNSSGQYVYSAFSDSSSLQTTIDERSLWEARLGIDIKFGQ